MEKVYYFIQKSDVNRILKNILVKNGEVYEFYIGQNRSEDVYVNQFTRLSNPLEIDLSNDFLDELVKLNSSVVNLPKGKENYSLVESENQVGGFFNRIYRPMLIEPSPEYKKSVLRTLSYSERTIQAKVFAKKSLFPIDEKGLLSSLSQLSLLTNSLHSIFQTIHPDKNSFGVYGHSIRNLLILACTEVETQLKGILNKNRYKFKSKSLTTKNYVCLSEILKLDSYKVKLDYYPWLDDFSPFKDWDKSNPTKSLRWYNDYNKAKHDRETYFSSGNIENVLNAIVAVAILIRAQYGEQDLYWKEHIGGFFKFEETPSWSIEEKYIPPLEGKGWEAVEYFLGELNK